MDLNRQRANLPIDNGQRFFPGAAAVVGLAGTTSVAVNETSPALFALGVATFAIVTLGVVLRPDRLGVTFSTSAICTAATFAAYTWGPALLPAIVLWGAGWRVQEGQRWPLLVAMAFAGLVVGLLLAIGVDARSDL